MRPSAPVAPAVFDHYLLFAHSNQRGLVERLRRAGLPADLVAGMHFSRGRRAITGVPWRRGAYVVSVRGDGFQAAHDHDNSYWHDGRAGTSQLEVRFYRATDRGCVDCGDSGVLAAARSPVARLLGASRLRRPFVGFDHNKIATGDATLFARRRLPPARTGPAGFLGVEGVASDRGVLVTKVLPGEPAAGAGIGGGDVVLAVDRTPVHSLGELLRLVSGMRPGSRAVFTILRRGARRTVAVTLGERPAP